jgi:hypothetical protein
MAVRSSALAAGFLLLAACSAQPEAPSASANAETIACRVGEAKAFAPVCGVERSDKNGIVTLIVRHPDGGFRRFDVLRNGEGLAVADGATQAIVRYLDGFAELAVGEDAYRIPITVKDMVDHAAKP